MTRRKIKKNNVSKKAKKFAKNALKKAQKVKLEDVEKTLARYIRLADSGIKEAEDIRMDIKKHWAKISRELSKK